MKKIFQDCTSKYISDQQQIERSWKEIETHYCDPARHYHTLEHLENMLLELKQVQIKDWDIVLFALFYHDIIYNTSSTSNEERSADLARSRLLEIGFPKQQIEKCRSIILATKSHDDTDDPDIKYFIDADLSILGQDWEMYLMYANSIRKEYSIYSDFMYKSGRRKVLNHFLSKNRIYKSNYFSSKFEQRAKENLSRELAML